MGDNRNSKSTAFFTDIGKMANPNESCDIAIYRHQFKAI